MVLLGGSSCCASSMSREKICARGRPGRDTAISIKTAEDCGHGQHCRPRDEAVDFGHIRGLCMSVGVRIEICAAVFFLCHRGVSSLVDEGSQLLQNGVGRSSHEHAV